MRSTIVLLLAMFVCPPTFGDSMGAPGAWLNLDYTYNNVAYSEALMNEKGNFPGVRGELGIGLGSNIGVSAGGEYYEGSLLYDGQTFGGTPIQTLTKDYFRDVRGMLNLFFGPLTLAGGVAQREWFDNLVVSYRRRTTYDYYPATLTLYRSFVYFRFEYDFWHKGQNKSYMSDVSAAEHDVSFTQNSGSGYGAEIGLIFPTVAHFGVRAFIAYHRWDVNDSDTQNDGVYNLVEPKNNTVTISGGLGLQF